METLQGDLVFPCYVIHLYMLLLSYFTSHLPLSRELPAKEVLEGLAILSELLDTLMQLVERHLVLEEGPAELGLVVDEGHLLDRLALRRRVRVELLRHGGCVVLQLLEQLRCDGEEVDTGESLDLAGVTEGCAHDDRLVVVLLVVVEDLLHGLHTRVVVARVVLARLVLVVPVKDLEMTSAKPRQMGRKAGHRQRPRVTRKPRAI